MSNLWTHPGHPTINVHALAGPSCPIWTYSKFGEPATNRCIQAISQENWMKKLRATWLTAEYYQKYTKFLGLLVMIPGRI